MAGGNIVSLGVPITFVKMIFGIFLYQLAANFSIASYFSLRICQVILTCLCIKSDCLLVASTGLHLAAL